MAALVPTYLNRYKMGPEGTAPFSANSAKRGGFDKTNGITSIKLLNY